MKCPNPGKFYASECAHLPHLCQPPPWLEDSVGYSSQIAEEVWFSHKEKKGLCVKETRFGLPVGGWGW